MPCKGDVLLVDVQKSAARYRAACVLEVAAAARGSSLDVPFVLDLFVGIVPLGLLPRPLVAHEARFEPQPLLLVLRAKAPRGLELALEPAFPSSSRMGAPYRIPNGERLLDLLLLMR